MITLYEQIVHALERGNTGTTPQEVLSDIDSGTLSLLRVPGGHASFRWINEDSVEVVTIWGDMNLVYLFYQISRQLGATKLSWAGRTGWHRQIKTMEARYGRQYS